MSLRRRLTLGTAGAVAMVVLLAAVGCYLVVRSQLRAQVDDNLRDRAGQVVRLAPTLRNSAPPDLPGPAPAALGGAVGYVQLVRADGSKRRLPRDDIALPVSRHVLEAARGEAAAYFSEAEVAGRDLRILTAPLPDGGAIQIARPLDEINAVLGRIRLIGAGALFGGIALAAALGLFTTRAALAPIERLTEASEHVARTRDLTRRIEAGGDDEVARLAMSFNTMLDALQESTAALDASLVSQRQLVADASHELRTPLTSIRTNIEILRDPRGISEAERHRTLDDLTSEMEDLSALVSDLIELARGDERLFEPEAIRFDMLVEEAVARAARHAPRMRFATELEATVVEGEPDRLERAVRNLLDNAAKFSPEHGEVEVRLTGGILSVRDHGAGIASEDLEHIFDRFYRAGSARAVPGSGLGLAIVRQVALAHGGKVWAAPAEGTGTRFSIRLPATRLESSAALR